MEDEPGQIRKQMASDCLAFKEMGQQFRTRIDQAATALQSLAREMEKRFNQVEEHRLSRMFEVMEASAEGWKPELLETKARLEQQAS